MRKRRPSEYLRRHLAGGAHDLDDLVSWHAKDADYVDVIEEVFGISDGLSTSEYPIGIGNPDSSAELEALASRLEAKGR